VNHAENGISGQPEREISGNLARFKWRNSTCETSLSEGAYRGAGKIAAMDGKIKINIF